MSDLYLNFSVLRYNCLNSHAQVLTDKNGTIFCVKAAQPKSDSWQDEVVKPMNEYLGGELHRDIEVAFAARKSVKSHASSAQVDARNSPCVSVGYTHGNGSKVSILFAYLHLFTLLISSRLHTKLVLINQDNRRLWIG